MEKQCIIDLDHVQKTYESSDIGSEPICAIEDISFDVKEHEFVSIVGPSGCGKSTLLNMIIGLFNASGGVIKLKGEKVTRPSSDNGIVFQYPVLLEWRNVYDNIMMPLEILKLDKSKYVDRAHELLDTQQNCLEECNKEPVSAEP
jgi:NitT/TauT family transport system ATP-binding protein